MGCSNLVTKYRAWLGVSAKIVEYCSHAYSQGIMPGESVKLQLLEQVLRRREFQIATYTFMLIAPTISRKLNFSGSDLWTSKSRLSMSFESSGFF